VAVRSGVWRVAINATSQRVIVYHPELLRLDAVRAILSSVIESLLRVVLRPFLPTYITDMPWLASWESVMIPWDNVDGKDNG